MEKDKKNISKAKKHFLKTSKFSFFKHLLYFIKYVEFLEQTGVNLSAREIRKSRLDYEESPKLNFSRHPEKGKVKKLCSKSFCPQLSAHAVCILKSDLNGHLFRTWLHFRTSRPNSD